MHRALTKSTAKPALSLFIAAAARIIRVEPVSNPILDFGIDKSTLQYVGHGLQRPECILAEPDGTLWSADARGGVVRLSPDGRQEIVTQRSSAHFAVVGSEAERYPHGTLPNGMAFARNRDILISNFGTDRLEIMLRDGETLVLAGGIDGEPIGKVNFVLRDSRDRNEIRFDGREEWLYVVETTGGCITRLRMDESGAPREREVFGPRKLGAWPDGIAFDSFGNLWGTTVYSDKLFVLTPEGDLRVLLDEGDPEKVDALKRQFFANGVTHDVLFATGRGIAPWMASVTSGGPDLRTAHIGPLEGSRIPYFRAPVPGLPLVHWKEERS
jgi:gluconolactonase